MNTIRTFATTMALTLAIVAYAHPSHAQTGPTQPTTQQNGSGAQSSGAQSGNDNVGSTPGSASQQTAPPAAGTDSSQNDQRAVGGNAGADQRAIGTGGQNANANDSHWGLIAAIAVVVIAIAVFFIARGNRRPAAIGRISE